jgi:translation initiation factor eIF-2B subunit epsilon
MSGVTEIYIYCGAHVDEVERYLKASKWNPPSSTSPFASLQIVRFVGRSVGDALRDLDARDLITGDFLLVHGDLVSNLPIDAALSAHRARRAADKNAIMTMILKEGGLGPHRTKAQGVTPVFVIDPTKQRCVHYEEIHPLQANKYVSIDPELLSDHPEMEIRTDLIDSEIDICTPDVLALWAESFDYEVARRHFLHGTLKDYMLNGKTIHTEIITDHYAARAGNLQAYEAISKDVLGRWTYPLVPDSNLVAGQTYRYLKGGFCKEDNVILARSCKIGKKTVLGSETSVGAGTTISNSIIGRRCQIGKNVTIEGAFIWDDVVICDNTTVTRAIIASEAVVGANSIIPPGALLSFGVRVAEKTVLKENQRLSRTKLEIDDFTGKSTSKTYTDESVVGKGGCGYNFEEEDEPEDEEALQTNLIYSTAHFNLSLESISTLASDISAASESGQRSRLSSFTSSIGGDDGDSNAGNENFHHDAMQGLLDTLRENGDFDSAKLEFMGLRLSADASDHQIRKAIAVAFTKRIFQLLDEGMDAAKATKAVLGVRSADMFLREVAIGKEKLVDKQIEFLLAVQRGCAGRAAGDAVLFAWCREVYERDIVEEEAFEGWWADDRSAEGEMGKVRELAGTFVKWLAEAEEEDSDEEESSEEEEEDSDEE